MKKELRKLMAEVKDAICEEYDEDQAGALKLILSGIAFLLSGSVLLHMIV